MRRLTFCLLAAAWLVVASTALAVEFKIDDTGSSSIQNAIQTTAPTPMRTPVYSPPSATRRIAQLPVTDGGTSLSVGDILESPLDAATPGTPGDVVTPSVNSTPIDNSNLLNDLGDAVNGVTSDPFNNGTSIEPLTDMTGDPTYTVTESAAQDYMPASESATTCTDGCGTGGPSCSQPGIDTSHVQWKGGDVFTADDCTGCSLGCDACGSGGGGLLGKYLGRRIGGGCGSGCTGCTDGCTSCTSGTGCCDCNSGCSPWFVTGWLSQGFTYNTDDPPSGFNTPLTFNDRDEEWMVNQVYLQFGRRVRESGCCWDWGGQIDLLYGTDYFFTQSTGLETRRDGSPHWNSSDGPRGTGASLYGLALPQAYLEFYSPWLRGVNVKLGHFYTTIGYESVMAPQNFFYSHAYTMQYGEPFTHTGILTSFNLGRNLTGHFGVTRGWDTWEDPNGTPGYLAGVSWTPSDVASVAYTIHSGREDSAGVNNRFAHSLVYTRQINNSLRYVMQHDAGSEANAEFDTNFAPDSAVWYGINNYLFLDLTNNVTLGLRAEWFRDQDNARVLAIPQESLVDGSNYAQVSLGLNVRAGDHFWFRPEIRYDWSDVVATGLAGNGMFNDFTEDNQLTIAGDMIFKF